MNLYVTKNMNAFILPNLPTGAVCFSFAIPIKIPALCQQGIHVFPRRLRSCFEFLQKVFLGLMYPFSCVLWAIFWSFPFLFFVRQPAIFLITKAKMPQKLIPNHRTINSKQLLNSISINVRKISANGKRWTFTGFTK